MKIISGVFILFFLTVVVYFSDLPFVFAQNSTTSLSKIDYSLAWPGILPDHPLYKIKVLRNKIIEKMIVSPVKRVEFDLLMADKTIYAAQLLMEKGKTELAKETVLKGENYYSMLVQDYNKVLLQGKKIPQELDNNITKAAQKHQEIFKVLQSKANKKDKETFQIVDKFSRINYDFIVNLRSPKKENDK